MKYPIWLKTCGKNTELPKYKTENTFLKKFYDKNSGRVGLVEILCQMLLENVTEPCVYSLKNIS